MSVLCGPVNEIYRVGQRDVSAVHSSAVMGYTKRQNVESFQTVKLGREGAITLLGFTDHDRSAISSEVEEVVPTLGGIHVPDTAIVEPDLSAWRIVEPLRRSTHRDQPAQCLGNHRLALGGCGHE